MYYNNILGTTVMNEEFSDCFEFPYTLLDVIVNWYLPGLSSSSIVAFILTPLNSDDCGITVTIVQLIPSTVIMYWKVDKSVLKMTTVLGLLANSLSTLWVE